MLEPIKFFCNFALPAVYDDSLSYYEALTKIAAKLNDTINALNTLTASVTGDANTQELKANVNSIGYVDIGEVSEFTQTDVPITSVKQGITEINKSLKTLAEGSFTNTNNLAAHVDIHSIAIENINQSLDKVATSITGNGASFEYSDNIANISYNESTNKFEKGLAPTTNIKLATNTLTTSINTMVTGFNNNTELNEMAHSSIETRLHTAEDDILQIKQVNAQTLSDITTIKNEVDELKSNRDGFVDLTGNVVFILPKQSTETWWNTAFIKDRICELLNKDANSVLIEWINPTTSTPANDIHSALLNIQVYESNHTGFSANTTALIIGLGAPTSGTEEGDYYYETENIVSCVSEFPNLKNTVILPSYGYNIYSMFSINERMLQMKEQIPISSAIIDNSLGDCLVLGDMSVDIETAKTQAMVNYCQVLCDYILYGIHYCNYFFTDSSFGYLKNVNGEISYFPNGTQIVSGTVNFNSLVSAINSAGINTSVGFGSGKNDNNECIFALAITNNAVGSTSYTAITPYKNTIILGRKFS